MIKKADSITLKEAREQERMNDFARQHEIPTKEQQPRARERFERVLGLMCRGITSPSKQERPHGQEAKRAK